jgi:hypothetical protein
MKVRDNEYLGNPLVGNASTRKPICHLISLDLSDKADFSETVMIFRWTQCELRSKRPVDVSADDLLNIGV